MRCGSAASPSERSAPPASFSAPSLLTPVLLIAAIGVGAFFGFKYLNGKRNERKAAAAAKAAMGVHPGSVYPQLDANLRVQAREGRKFWIAGTWENRGDRPIVSAKYTIDCKFHRSTHQVGALAPGQVVPYEKFLFEGDVAYCEGGVTEIDFGQ